MGVKPAFNKNIKRWKPKIRYIGKTISELEVEMAFVPQEIKPEKKY